MDTISCANTISYAMEANEKGIWDNGLKFSETKGISALFEDIAYRRGIGDELALGSRRLSEKYGGKDFAIHAKGMELAAYEPRKAVGLGLGYATSNRGGCHLNGGYLVILEGLGLSVNQTTYHGKGRPDHAVPGPYGNDFGGGTVPVYKLRLFPVTADETSEQLVYKARQ